MEGETLTYLLLCEEYRVRTKHSFVNKFWRRLKLLGLDLPFGSPKPRVIFYSKCPLSVYKAAQPLTGTSLYFDMPEKGRGVGRSGTAI